MLPLRHIAVWYLSRKYREESAGGEVRTREEALVYGLSFPGTYQEAPFHDPNWQLVRVQGSKKRFYGLMKWMDSSI